MLRDSPRCHAKTRDGDQCEHWPMHGQRVCHMHGGKAPRAMARAEERLRELEHPAITTLAHVIEHGDNDAVRLAAARYLLELLGHRAAMPTQIDQAALQVTVVFDRNDPQLDVTSAQNGHSHTT